jgi:hypothetical protein
MRAPHSNSYYSFLLSYLQYAGTLLPFHMFRSPRSCAPSPSPGFLLLAPSSLDSASSVLKSPSYTSSALPAAPSLFSFFCKKSAKLTPLFSISYTLFKKECFANFFTISSFRTSFAKHRGCTFTRNPKASHVFHSCASAHAQQSPQPNYFHTFASRFSGYPGGGASHSDFPSFTPPIVIQRRKQTRLVSFPLPA